MKDYKAVRVEQLGSGDFRCTVKTLPLSSLPDNDVLVRVVFSALNYKDALSASGHPGVSRHFPHTPGIDAAGEVVEDRSGRFARGDPVLISGYDFGMGSPGGLAQYCRVPAEWVCPCPGSLSLFDAMVYGTAGVTAALALQKIERMRELRAQDSFVVTGASGGVGSVAVLLAASKGLKVTAISAKESQFERLKALGASDCLPAHTLSEASAKPLLGERWCCGLDTLGGETLVNLLKSTVREGVIASCGLAASPALNTSVYPFILRGVSLLGIDSAEQSLSLKQSLWTFLANCPLNDKSSLLAHTIELNEVPAALDQMLAGNSSGRALVKL